jgi:molybdopterin-synthase adenylyltransferase
MNNIDTLRLTGMFDEELDHCSIIGCGAIGSKLAVELAKIGVPKITLYDDDIVENHNLSNQAFSISHLGQNKAVATSMLIKAVCDVEIEINQSRVTEDNVSELRGFVFLCVDSMPTRRMLVNNLRKNPFITGIIEARMGVYDINVYDISPLDADKWLVLSSFDDSVVETSACGSPLSVGATSSIAASIMTWNYMKHYMKDGNPIFETILSIDPWGMLTNK